MSSSPSIHPALSARLAFAAAMAGVVGLSNWLVQFPIGTWLTYGAFTFPIAFLVTDVCNRCFGAARAREVAFIGFAIGLGLSFMLAPVRIALASGVAFLVAQLLDVAIFNRLRRAAWWKAPFIGSVVASILDTALFFYIAFGHDELNWLALAAGDLSVKLIMAVLLLAPYRALVFRLARTADGPAT